MSSLPENPLPKLLASQRVLITVGAGGVGKTTTAAALGVAAARSGKRVLCLTIDPARRLAESLGLERMSTEAVTIDAARFRDAGVPIEGSLTVMMLDTKRTFDEFVKKHASTPAKAKALLDNKLYKYVSTTLAGTQEYMAMEKLVAVRDDPAYDLVVLDTPPTANALDFLDAPERLIDALDSPAMRWFIEAFQESGKVSLNLLAKSAAVVLKTIGKVTGGGFLDDMAAFIVELNDLFGGFKERATMVQKALRAKDTSFLLVTSPAPMSIREVLYFSERLEEHKMPRGAFIVNRLRTPPPRAGEPPSEPEVREAVKKQGLTLDDDAPERLLRAHSDAVKLATLDARHVKALDDASAHAVPIVRVPQLASDVRDIALLGVVADLLIA